MPADFGSPMLEKSSSCRSGHGTHKNISFTDLDHIFAVIISRDVMFHDSAMPPGVVARFVLKVHKATAPPWLIPPSTTLCAAPPSLSVSSSSRRATYCTESRIPTICRSCLAVMVGQGVRLEPGRHRLLEGGAPELCGRWKDPSPARELFLERLPVGKSGLEQFLGKLFAIAASAMKKDDGVGVLGIWLENVKRPEGRHAEGATSFGWSHYGDPCRLEKAPRQSQSGIGPKRRSTRCKPLTRQRTRAKAPQRVRRPRIVQHARP
ncbi:hypothetical protein VTH82DRAFT_8412 [Thermothelomyces myriococcoides]